MLGRNARFLRGSDDAQPELQRLRPAIEKAQDFYGVLRNYKKDGALFWNKMYVSPVRDEDGRVTHFVGVQNDVTERVTLEERLEHQATHDPLTDLPNRRLLSDRIGSFAGGGVAVLFVDLDGFKVVNDSLGHDAGDRLLVGVANRLAECLGDKGTAARFGGDKFVVLLDAAGEAERVAGNLSEALRPPFYVDGRELFVTASIGIALGAAGGPQPGRLLRNADLAMHQAKRAGKNRHALFEESMDAAARERLEITEGAMMAEVRGTIAVLGEFKKLGVGIALDDFGTGYSSLSYLKRFPVDYVKIDRSMVTGLNEDRSNRAIVLSTITLAHALDLEVVAEGVETASEHEVLRDLRCDFGQGYLFARPLPGEEAGNLLAAGLRHGATNGN